MIYRILKKSFIAFLVVIVILVVEYIFMTNIFMIEYGTTDQTKIDEILLTTKCQKYAGKNIQN